MSDRNMLELISAAIRPAKNVRVHFTRQVFDQSLTSQIPLDADEEMLLPTFEYTLTLCDKGWMYLETMKGGCYKKYEEERGIQKTFHATGVFRSRLRNEMRSHLRINLRSRLPFVEYYGLSCVRLPVLDWFWAGFMGYGDIYGYLENRWLRLNVGVSDGFYSVNRSNTRYLFDGSEGSRVVKVQYLFADGRVDFESVHDIKQFPNGVWFQMGYDMMRYADPKAGREARFHRCVRVTDVEFDIDFDENTFELPEGIDAITMPT